MAKPRVVRGHLPPSEAATHLDISRDRLGDYAERGLIPFIRIGPLGWRYYATEDLDAFAESYLTPARDDAQRGAA
jgi:hypothetical protein